MLALVQGGVVVLAIGILIFVHELGHFLVAKKVGIRVEAFSLGFGPTIWGFTRGDTTYKLSLIPLGGYVKMAGEFKEEGDVDTGDEFFAKTISQRAWVVSAGVIMNVFFAIIAFPLAFSIGVPFSAPVVGTVIPGDSAWDAGIRPGDRVKKIDNADVISFADIRTSVAFNDEPQLFVIERKGKEVECEVVPRYDDSRGLHVIGLLGRNRYFFSDTAEDLPEGINSGMELIAVDGVPLYSGLSIDAGNYTEGEIITLTVCTEEDSTPIDVKVPAKFKKIDGDGLSVGVAFNSTRVAKVRAAKGNRSVAESLGFQIDDTLLAVNGKRLEERDTLPQALYAAKGQKALNFTIRREGKEVTLSINDWDGEPESFLTSIQFGHTDDIAILVTAGGAAEKAGLQNGDVLVSYAGKSLKKGWDGFLQFKELKEETGDKNETIIVRRNGEELTFGVKAAPTMVNSLVAQLDARPFQERVQLPFPASVTVGFDQAVSQCKSILMTLKSLFAGKVAAKNLGGIITIAVVSYTFVEQGLGKILFFMAILSLNLAVLNILPIPVLDGGHLMFLILEKIKGGPLSEKVMGYANVLGLVFILGLMLFVTFHDIRRFFF
ncbi:MAG: regulator of sigma E protease [Planctomycetota bacterium]